MSHTMISAAILLASIAAASALFRPPFLPVFGGGPVMPLFGPGPLMTLHHPLVSSMALGGPMVRYQGRQRRSRVGQQVENVGSAESRPRSRPFVPKMSNARRSERPIDVAVNLIDNRPSPPSNVYLVDYGRDSLFDNSLDISMADPTLGFDMGLGGIPLGGPGVSAMDMGAGFITDDRFRSGDVSIDGNVYISNSPTSSPVVGGALGAPVVGGAMGAPLGNSIAPGVAGVGAPDVFDYGLSGMPLNTGSIAIGNAPPAATVPLV